MLESAPEGYLPVYPPQVALVFAPLSDLPHHAAAAIWALVNLAVYAWAIWLAWHPLRAVMPGAALVTAAAYRRSGASCCTARRPPSSSWRSPSAHARCRLEPSAGLMQSWAAVTRLLPGPLSTVVWLLAGAWTSWLVVRAWRTADALALRVGALAIGSVLVNPHVNL